MWLMARDIDRPRVVKTTEWLKQVAEGAALATQTNAKVNVFFGMHDLVSNAPLAERMQTYLEEAGAPAWTDEEHAFARACQQQMGIPEQGLATTVMPLLTEQSVGGSSDVAEASWLTPTMGITMPTMPLKVPLHTWAVTACGGSSIGLKGALRAAEVLTRMALAVLTDAELRAAARADFEQRMAGATYVSPLPPEQRHPYALPAWLITDGSTEALAHLERNAAL
jgi:aminobenzoyl-glutamate utilization protein B